MKVRIISTPGEKDWEICKELTLGTIGKTAVTPVDSKFKDMIIRSEHSPIRSLNVVWEWEDLPYWVSVHLVRHHVGITHYVSTQRNDRQDNYDRNEAPQDALVLHRCTANIQSILDISRSRLCQNASAETRWAWLMFLLALRDFEPELIKYCVPNCIYRNGLCPEPKQCEHGVDAYILGEHRKLFKRGDKN